MARPAVRIHGNFLASALRHNTVSWEDAGARSARLALGNFLDRLCGTERAAALAAMDVLKRRTDIANTSPDDGAGRDHDVIQAYYTLKEQLMDAHFSENLDTGTLVITGLAAQPLTLTVDKDAIPYLRLQGWKDIAGLFQSAHQDAAQGAFTRLVCARTGAAQLAAFADLHQYVRYISPPPLSWQVSSQGPAVFRVGQLAVPCDTERAALANAFGLDDTARLLCAIHYEDQHVLSTFHRMPTVAAKDGDALLRAQINYLDSEPALVDALKRLGLHQHDDDGRYAHELGRSVEELAAGFHTATDADVDGFAQRSTLHAQTLVNILGRYFNGSRLERLALSHFVWRERRVPVRPGPTR